jgi:acyl dehydratase
MAGEGRLMPTTYEALMALKAEGLTFSYNERDTMLYALSIGMGENPVDERELSFVFEGGGLQAVPTQACVIARSSLLMDAGLDRAKIVHGEQRVELRRPLPPSAQLVASAWIDDVRDKGAGKGALVMLVTDVRLADAPDEPLCRLRSTIFARGDGGVGGPAGAVEPPRPVPARAPDRVSSYQTSANQALLYRLNGDRNPLHAEPAFAARAGFAKPILHGLCTYGIACRALLAGPCDYDPSAMASFDARFTAPVYPGERITTEMWDEEGEIAFRCRVEARGVIALDYGKCTLRD